MLVDPAPGRFLKYLMMQTIHDESPLPFFFEQVRIAQDPEMMRQRDDLDSQQIGQIAHVLRTVAERIDDSKPQRFAEGLEPVGA